MCVQVFRRRDLLAYTQGEGFTSLLSHIKKLHAENWEETVLLTIDHDHEESYQLKISDCMGDIVWGVLMCCVSAAHCSLLLSSWLLGLTQQLMKHCCCRTAGLQGYPAMPSLQKKWVGSDPEHPGGAFFGWAPMIYVLSFFTNG